MYEELVSELRERAEFLACAEPLNIKNAFAESMKQAADAIEELSKQVELEHQSGFADGQIAANRKKPRWIPVTERLPEENGQVLAYYGFNRGDGYLGMMFMQVLDYYATDPKPHFQHESMGVTVTHWMPLPEPPKGEATT